MNSHQYPSELPSTVRTRYKPTHKPMALKTDWASGAMWMLFILMLVTAVLAGLYFLVLEDLFSQLQAVTDSLPRMELTSAGGK